MGNIWLFQILTNDEKRFGNDLNNHNGADEKSMMVKFKYSDYPIIQIYVAYNEDV